MITKAGPQRGPRCTERSCPVRWRSGDDRPCRDHANQAAADDQAATAGLLDAPGGNQARAKPA
jgi:hypothetical protein